MCRLPLSSRPPWTLDRRWRGCCSATFDPCISASWSLCRRVSAMSPPLRICAHTFEFHTLRGQWIPSRCLLPVACCLLLVAYCLLPVVVCCLLPAACCILHIYCIYLHIAYCALLLACCPLPVAGHHATQVLVRSKAHAAAGALAARAPAVLGYTNEPG